MHNPLLPRARLHEGAQEQTRLRETTGTAETPPTESLPNEAIKTTTPETRSGPCREKGRAVPETIQPRNDRLIVPTAATINRGTRTTNRGTMRGRNVPPRNDRTMAPNDRTVMKNDTRNGANEERPLLLRRAPQTSIVVPDGVVAAIEGPPGATEPELEDPPSNRTARERPLHPPPLPPPRPPRSPAPSTSPPRPWGRARASRF